MTPGSLLTQRRAPSPNFEPRRPGAAIDILLLHYTGMACCDKAVSWLAAPESRVSSHYVIDEDGVIIQMVAEDMRAWHAGVAHWAGVDDVNSHSIGVEIHNPGHGPDYRDFPEAQMRAVEALCLDIVARYPVPPSRVLGHSDVAPRRKRDPGERFDWARLARAGVGHWVEPAPIGDDEGLGLGDFGPAVLRLQRQLRAYGYWIEAHALYDEHTEIVVAAFQRHFRPALVDGRADASTIDTLDRLILSRSSA
ncbi:MAG: N-acetylmuramoyl-L-alanine amidase [Hyphomicrobiales bacterium]|nr:N-acetylmuramoyl-L-alanine amidase [Hyphomicrobiales bacterium]